VLPLRQDTNSMAKVHLVFTCSYNPSSIVTMIMLMNDLTRSKDSISSLYFKHTIYQ